MDAYQNYLRQLAETRLNDLRREAAEYRLAASLTAGKTRRWFGFAGRLRPRAARRAPASPVAKPVRLPRPMTGSDQDLRRSA